jgi:hypothetical protein
MFTSALHGTVYSLLPLYTEQSTLYFRLTRNSLLSTTALHGTVYSLLPLYTEQSTLYFRFTRNSLLYTSALHGRKRCSGFLSPLKIHRPGSGSNPRTLGPVASTLTTSPPRATVRYLVFYNTTGCKILRNLFSLNAPSILSSTKKE